MTFDGWNTQYYGDCLTYGQDSLMHFRTKGSKNGVRRYQTEDGTWTELGLRERRAREGFGDGRSARRERREARNERRAYKAQQRQENWKRAQEYKAQQAEARRKRNPKNLTDEELQAKINRLKMEQEYKELSKSPLLKTGEQLATKYMDYKTSKLAAEEKKKERAYNIYRMNLERKNAQDRTKADIQRAKADTERAKADMKRSEADALEVKQGKKAAVNQAKLIDAKANYRKGTLWGGWVNARNTRISGEAERNKALGLATVESDANVKAYKSAVRYNRFRKKENRMSMPLTSDQRTAAKNRSLLDIAKQKAEQERQKAEQERWKAEQERRKNRRP